MWLSTSYLQTLKRMQFLSINHIILCRGATARCYEMSLYFDISQPAHDSLEFPFFWPFFAVSPALCLPCTFSSEEFKPLLHLDLGPEKVVTSRLYCLCLSQIAEHVDSADGFLSKLSLYKALALIALAQQGKQPSPKLLENCIQGEVTATAAQ